ncbi:MAG: enoyl-CoA hydratase [Candidatus Binatia bacterium]
MKYEQILYEVDDHIATVTLNRPDRLNAWTPVMEREVREAMTQASADDAVRVIILTGAGRGFCAGADMSGLNNASQNTAKPGSLPERIAATRAEAYASGPIPGGLELPPAFAYRHAYFPTVPKPIIAALNGPTAGVGLVVTLYTDLRFASQSAVFTTAFARRGLVAEHGIDWILPRIVGLPNAIDLLLSARRITAEEALQMGLVNKVFPQESFMSEVRAYALELATMVSPRSMRVMKQQLLRAQNLDFGAALHASIADVVESLASEDFKEGVAHFVEKRAPNFPGR